MKLDRQTWNGYLFRSGFFFLWVFLFGWVSLVSLSKPRLSKAIEGQRTASQSKPDPDKAFPNPFPFFILS